MRGPLNSPIQIALGLVVLLSVACQPPTSRDLVHETTISDHGGVKPEAAPEAAQPEQKPSVLMTHGVREETLPAYEVPEPIRAEISRVQPELAVQLFPKVVTAYRVSQPYIEVRLEDASVTFSGVLHIKGVADEKFLLRCEFDKSKTPWTCNYMVPVDEKIASQQRLQATFKCVDANFCNRMGIKLFVAINGVDQEPLIFQAEPFQISEATSGDSDESPEPAAPTPTPTPDPAQRPSAPIETAPGQAPTTNIPLAPEPMPPPAVPKPDLPAPREQTTPPLVQEKPRPETPRPEVKLAPQILPPAPLDLSQPERLREVLSDPNRAVQFTTPMRMPAPAKGRYSIPKIEQIHVEPDTDVPNQAIGSHTRGSMQGAVQMPPQGSGFVSRDHRKGVDFATNFTRDILLQTFAAVDKAHPNLAPILLGNISKKMGGPRSDNPVDAHQTGLDVDIGFPATHTGATFLQACTRVTGDNLNKTCLTGSPVTPEWDKARFWTLIKVLTSAKNKPVIVIFLDKELKRSLCHYVKSELQEDVSPGTPGFHALRALRHERSHHHHVHVRLMCPGNRDCQNTLVTMANTTGC